jgi:1,5-anhydro-D-fructose reductase (1,5-anhydro-D-mannitol-forming)
MKWAVIGASTIAKEWMISAIRATGGEVAMLMSSDKSRAERFAREASIESHSTDIREICESKVISAVYISTTNELHHPHAMACLNAGKHVLCEKPLAMTLSGAAEMVRTAEQKGLSFGTNHHLRHAGTHRAIRKAIHEGQIGKPLSVRVNHAVFLPPHLQGWRINNAAAGGGVALDITVHDADTLRFLLGENPEEVVAMTQRGGMSSHDLEDGIMGIFRFPSGVTAQFHDAFTVKFAGTSLEVHGTEGSIIAQDVMTQKPIGNVLVRTAGGDMSLSIDRQNLYEHAVTDFHTAVRTGCPTNASGEDGLWSLASGLAAAESAKTGSTRKISIG